MPPPVFRDSRPPFIVLPATLELFWTHRDLK